MRLSRRTAIVALALVLAAGCLLALLRHGFSAREEPFAVEAFVARHLRRMAVPAGVRGARNPVALSPAVLGEARAHFADHCASCHANDGSGSTEIGRNLYPKAPDMRLATTQDLTDGELFSIIENGIRFTGMPAWGNGTPEGETESWELVHFIRRLPRLTPQEREEMERLNPVSPAELKEREEEEKFLQGGSVTPSTAQPR
ncbi:MAG TPA: c-type cytochrome [Thermoanaerobaculia bacterium]|nr:c-type cytochrome [Thermoanaerobaculia bacterium]